MFLKLKKNRQSRACALHHFVMRCLLLAAGLAGQMPAGAVPAPAVLQTVQLTGQVRMIPVISGGHNVVLETTLYLPPGVGPFPVLIMNHGKAGGDPHLQERDRFVAISREFVRRGYAVIIPMRTGFAHSGGHYLDTACNMTQNGQMQADDIAGVVAYLGQQPWADRTRILIGGQSHGGLAALAYGSRDVTGIRGLINFAGGLRSDAGHCDWKAALVQTFTQYGATSRVPGIWFYGANDSFFNPALAAALYHAFTGAGGNARLIAFDAFRQDAHMLGGSREGVRIWWPETERFLTRIGMPTVVLFSFPPELHFPKTLFAAIDNVEAIPYLQPTGRAQYRVFLGKPTPRAFAVSTSGGWSWAQEGDDTVERVLATCERSSGEVCKLYAIDNDVVWTSND